METTFALLYPDETPADNQGMYGWELDAVLSCNLKYKLRLMLELDIFKYGDFFTSQEDDISETASRYLIGVSCFF